jgi:MIP family channel proteins
MDCNVRAFVAEFLGTFALVFLSAGAVCAVHLPSLLPVGVLGIAVTQACVLAVALSATVYVSGGYLNPAITITLWVLRRLDNLRAAGFLAAQLLGAVLAGGLLRLAFDNSVLIPSHFGSPHVTEAYGPLTISALTAAAGLEVVLTFLLTFVIFGTVIDPRAPRLGGLGAGLTVGLALVAITFLGFNLTGAAVNPARAFGAAVWEWTYEPPNLRELVFVYWIGPIVGALLAGLAYTYLILPPEKKDEG